MTTPKLTALLILLCSLFACKAPDCGKPLAAKQDCAIVGAFEEEITWLVEQLESTQEVHIMGCRFIMGTVGKQNVVVGLTGIGKVNAGMSTALIIERFAPDRLIFTGVAGALNPELGPGDIVLGTSTVQHDLGMITPEGITRFGVRNPVNNIRNPVVYPADDSLFKLAEKTAARTEFEKIPAKTGDRIPKVISGVIATGDSFITSIDKKTELRRDLDASAVEMEGAAVAQVCYQMDVPFFVLRALSDNSDEYAEQDFERFYKVAARNANRLVLDMLKSPDF